MTALMVALKTAAHKRWQERR